MSENIKPTGKGILEYSENSNKYIIGCDPINEDNISTNLITVKRSHSGSITVWVNGKLKK